MYAGIICLVVFWICAGVFFGIGIYASKLKKPMWFWSDIKIQENQIKDIKSYNKANSRMWKIYSTPYWIAGILSFWDMTVSGIIVFISCTLGIAFLIIYYGRIEKKYKI